MNKAVTKQTPKSGEAGYFSSLFTSWWQRKHRLVEEGILLAVLAIIVFGIGLTDVSPTKSYQYWRWMVLVFAIGGLVIGVIKSYHHKLNIWTIFKDQLVLWGTTLAGIYVVYLMLGAGRLTYESTGLVILLLLGLAMFLDGYYRVGWRFSVLGILVIFFDLVATYLSSYIWLVVMLGAALWPLSILVEIYLIHRQNQKNKDKL